MLHYLYTYPETIVDGDGIRFSIYLSGCRHHCRGCHNPESWNPASGHPLTREKIEEFIEAINSNPLLDGITFSGGDPFYSPEDFLPLIKEFSERTGQNIWCYTGSAVLAAPAGTASRETAMHTASRNVMIRLFISLSLSFCPQCFHGLEPGGLCRRINAEQNSQRHRQRKGAQGNPRRRVDGHLEHQPSHQQAAAGAVEDADDAAYSAEHGRLDEELDDDAAPLGTNGPADADLPGPFGDGHQHDVHDADAAHQQADGGDTAQNQGDHAHLLVLLLLPGVLLVHLEAACVGINHSLQKAADAGAGLDHVLAAAGLHDELLRCVAAQHPAGGVGQNDDIVDLAGGCAFTGKAGGIDPHHLKALPVELEHLAHGVRPVGKEVVYHALT